MSYQDTITLTFGDQAENHVGMQKIGQSAPQGLDHNDLINARDKFVTMGYTCELIHLNEALDEEKKLDNEPFPKVEDAYVLVVKNGVEILLEEKASVDDMYAEQKQLTPDTKAFMYGRVVNKLARYNLCFGDISQDPDYINKKGRIVAWDSVPLMKNMKTMLPTFFGSKAKHLTAEGNYYYDVKKCGIGFHGDAERKIVIAARLGANLPLHYQWYFHKKRVGKRVALTINHGDMYAMSEKATGCDWRTSTAYTLRHAAGCKKYTT